METIVRLFELTLLSSLEAAVMVGLILLILAAFRRKLAPFWRYALWTLLIVKLLLPWIPGNLGDDFHWIRLPERIVSKDFIGIQELDSHAEPAGHVSSRAEPAGRDGESFTPSKASPSFSVMEIAAVVWLAGASAAVIYILYGHMKFSVFLRKEGRAAVPSDLQDLFVLICKRSGIRLPVSLRLSSQVTTPTLFGLISPVVLIPRNMADQLNAVEWECVFRHELVHYKRMDIWVNTIFTLLAAVHWFNPAIWYGLHRMRFEQEAACDASVLAALGTKDTYADSLIKVLEIGASQRSAPAGIGFSNYKNVIKRRMNMIRNYQPSNKRAALLGTVVLCIVALFALPSTFAKEFAKNPASAEDVQAEGEQKETVSPSTGVLEEISFVMPASGKITSVFGYRTHPVTKQPLLHDGIDIANREGTDVFASSSGKVIKAEYDSAYGFTVVIEHNESWQSEYRHLKELSVNQGDIVNTNDGIGQMGHTGQATGSHLHFSIRKDGEYLDPEPLLHE